MAQPAQVLLFAISLALLLGGPLAWLLIVDRWRRGKSILPFEPRPVVPWNGIDVAVLIFALVFSSSIAHQLTPHPPAGQAVKLTAESLAATGISRLVWFALAVIYLIGRSGALPSDLGFDHRRVLVRDALRGIWLFFAAALPVYAVQLFFVQVLKFKSEHPLVSLTKERPTLGVLALSTAVAVVVAPLVEEFAFRVVLQGWLERQQTLLRQSSLTDGVARPGFAPVVLVSLIFALLHWGYGPDPIALFFLSLFLGYAYRQTHRIYTPLALHACVNGLAVLNLWLLYLGGDAK